MRFGSVLTVRNPRDFLVTRTAKLLGLALLLATLPWLTTTTYASWRDGRNATNLVNTCAQFVHAHPGWRTADDTLTDAMTFEVDARTDLVAAYTVALAQLQSNIQTTPPDTVRLHALPLHRESGPLGGEQRLAGRTLALNSSAPHSPPGATALYVDIPWRGGAFAALDLTGPCGTYHQQFSFFQSGDNQAVVTVVTQAGGKQISKSYLSVNR